MKLDIKEIVNVSQYFVKFPIKFRANLLIDSRVVTCLYTDGPRKLNESSIGFRAGVSMTFVLSCKCTGRFSARKPRMTVYKSRNNLRINEDEDW